MRYEEKIRNKNEDELIKKCWNEKESSERRNAGLYEKEREKFYSRNGWSRKGIEDNRKAGNNMEKEIRERGRDIQKQEEERKIREAKYNKEYGKIKTERWNTRIPKKKKKKRQGNSYKGNKIRALVRTRCGNLEEGNKYWLEKEKRKCAFCGKGRDKIEHFVEECETTRDWFIDLRANWKERIKRLRDENMNEKKRKILINLWKEKEKAKNKRQEKNASQNVIEFLHCI